MSARYYGPLIGLAASLSFTLAGCGGDRPPDTVAAPANAAPTAQKVAAADSDPEGTDQTIWTVLGLAKRESQRNRGPQTGATVSPELWQAALDALGFAGIASEDPVTGLIVTKWYSPPDKPDEQLRVTAFVLARALRSDSVAVTVERQARTPDGQWQTTPVAREVVDNLDAAILQRARQIHAQRYRETVYQ